MSKRLSGCRFALFCALMACFIFSGAANGAILRIVDEHGSPRGERFTQPIRLENSEFGVSGFDLLLALNERNYVLLNASLGESLSACGWEYFTYRRLNVDSLGYNIGKFTSLIHFVGIGSLSGSPVACPAPGVNEDLLNLDILITNVFEVDCYALPLAFYWRGCDDNYLVDPDGATRYIGKALFRDLYSYLINDTTFLAHPGFGIPDSECPAVEPEITRAVDFINGYIDVPCTDTAPTWRGDVNLNGIPFEVGDMIAFANYFLCGYPCLPDPIIWYPEFLCSTTDINMDGICLSVADFVHGVRILIGEILATEKPAPETSTNSAVVSSSINDGTLRVDLISNADIGGIYLQIESDGSSPLTIDDFTYLNPLIQMGERDDKTTMLLVDMERLPALTAGTTPLLTSRRTDLRVSYVEAVDAQADPLAVKTTNSRLPNSFVLYQNYPNPFNPATEIGFYLPTASDWRLSIYNSLGQLVRDYAGRNEYEVKISWDGRDAEGKALSSGLYLYKLEAGDFFDSRKMLLLK